MAHSSQSPNTILNSKTRLFPRGDMANGVAVPDMISTSLASLMAARVPGMASESLPAGPSLATSAPSPASLTSEASPPPVEGFPPRRPNDPLAKGSLVARAVGGGAERRRVQAVPDAPIVHSGHVLPGTHGSATIRRGRGLELSRRRSWPRGRGPSRGRSGGPSGGRWAPGGGTRGRCGRRGRLLCRAQRDRVGRGVPGVAARHRLADLGARVRREALAGPCWLRNHRHVSACAELLLGSAPDRPAAVLAVAPVVSCHITPLHDTLGTRQTPG